MLNLYKFFCITFFFLLHCSYGFSQDTTKTESIPSTFCNDINSGIHDVVFLWNGVKNFDCNDACTLAGIVGGTSASMMLDDEVRTFSQKNRSKFNDEIFSFSNEFGQLRTAIGMSGGLYLIGLFSGSEEIRTCGRLLGEALLLSGGITSFVKFTAGRSRPYMNEGNAKYRFFQSANDYNSIPSGHSTVTFSMATILAGRINRWWAYPTCYLAATLTAGARIYKDQHWLSDVLLGAAIGTYSGLAILKAEEHRLGKKSDKASIILYPIPCGIGVAYNF